MPLAQNEGKTPIDMNNPKCGQTGQFQNSTACPIRKKELAKAAEYDKLQHKVQAIKKKTESDDKESKKATAANLLMQGLLNGASDLEDVLIRLMLCQLGSLIDGFVKQSNDGGQREDGIWNHTGVQSTRY